MLSVLGTLSLIMFVIILSKFKKELRWSGYIQIIFISLLQVCIVILVMYALDVPLIKIPR